MALESTAIVLTERLDALAAALRDAGVSPERSTSLLAAAASATMQALTLDALLEQQSNALSQTVPAAVRPAADSVSLAA